MKLVLVCSVLSLAACLGKWPAYFQNVHLFVQLDSVQLNLFALASAGIPVVPIATMLYKNGYVIGKGFDLRYLDYKHYTDESGNDHILSFNAAGNDSKRANAYMVLHKNYSDHLTAGFAVESYEGVYEPDEKHCREITPQKLSYLIQSCYASIYLRELTWQEKIEMWVFQLESKGKPV